MEDKSVTEFLGGTPEDKLDDDDYEISEIIANDAQYFPDKTVNNGDVLILMRGIQKEALRKGMNIRPFSSHLMFASMMMMRSIEKNEAKFRAFCKLVKSEIDEMLEQYLGIYISADPPIVESELTPQQRAQIDFRDTSALTKETLYFPIKAVRYMDLCIVLSALEKEAITKGIKRNKLPLYLISAALFLRKNYEPEIEVFRKFCKEEKANVDRHLENYLKNLHAEKNDKPSDTSKFLS